jgi:hypothetical protein
MPNRTHLIAYWRSRLLVSQQQCDEGSIRLRWLRRAYARIYRFLLSQYGDAGDAPLTGPPSKMPLVDNTLDIVGRPPKTIGKIQATLKHIHNASGRSDEPGPLAGGVTGDLWLVVASRRERWIPSKCASLLRRNGINARTATRSGDVVVEVERNEFGAAAAILESCRWSLSYRNRYSVPRGAPLLYALVGGCVGVLIGLVFASFCIYLEHDPVTGVKLLYLLAGSGAVAGFVTGCVSALNDSTTLQPATTWTSTLIGGVLGGFFGMVFGFLFLPWFAVLLFQVPGSADTMARVTVATTVFGLLSGWIMGCWIGFRDFRSRTRNRVSETRHPHAKPTA